MGLPSSSGGFTSNCACSNMDSGNIGIGSLVAHSRIFQLPTDVLTQLLGQWLTLIEISKLDVCISHLILRRNFFKIISSKGVVFDGSEVFPYTSIDSSYFTWLFTRNISVRKLKFGLHTDSGVGYFLQEKVCLHLQSLDLSSSAQLYRFDLNRVLVNCPRLEELIVWENSKENMLNRTALVTLATNCKELKILSMFNNVSIDTETMLAVVQSCRHICELNFHFCYSLENAALECVAVHCNKNLRKLSIRTNDAITDVCMKCIAKHCPQLQVLKIQACNRVTVVGVEAVAQKCKMLQFLSLSATMATDETLAAVADNCAQLEYICLSYCHLITDTGVLNVVQKCRLLTNLDVKYCHGLSTNLQQVIYTTFTDRVVTVGDLL